MSGPTVAYIVGSVAIAAVGIAVVRMIMKTWSRPGRRPDGSWEEGRRVRDMTAGGKFLLAVAIVAFAATLVLRFVDRGSPWFWGCLTVAIVTSILGYNSEKRRVRRQGIDPPA